MKAQLKRQLKRPLKWRYAAFGAGFVGLAGVRLSQDEPVWAAVFAVAAAVNLWLCVHEGARQAAPAAAAASAPAPVPASEPEPEPEPERAEVERSLAGYRTSARQWQLLGAACVLVGAGLLTVVPALAVFAGAAALFALHRAHRAGRAVATLSRAALARR